MVKTQIVLEPIEVEFIIKIFRRVATECEKDMAVKRPTFISEDAYQKMMLLKMELSKEVK